MEKEPKSSEPIFEGPSFEGDVDSYERYFRRRREKEPQPDLGDDQEARMEYIRKEKLEDALIAAYRRIGENSAVKAFANFGEGVCPDELTKEFENHPDVRLSRAIWKEISELDK